MPGKALATEMAKGKKSAAFMIIGNVLDFDKRMVELKKRTEGETIPLLLYQFLPEQAALLQRLKSIKDIYNHAVFLLVSLRRPATISCSLPHSGPRTYTQHENKAMRNAYYC
jgi:hypothetical protein